MNGDDIRSYWCVYCFERYRMSVIRSSHLKGLFAGLAGYSFFAFAEGIYKYLGSEYSVFTMSIVGSSVVVILTLLSAMLQKDFKRTFVPQRPAGQLLRAFMLAVQFFVFIGALTYFDLDMDVAYPIAFSAPFVVTVLGWLVFKDQTHWYHWVSVATGFVGVMFIVRPGMVPFDWGVGLVLCSVVLTATTNLMLRVVMREGDNYLCPVFYTVSFNILISVMAILIGFGGGIEVPQMFDLMLLSLCGVCSFLGLLCIVYGFAHYPANMVAPGQYVQMVWAVLFGALVFDTDLSGVVYFGAGIVILSGLFLIAMRQKYSRR